MEVFGEHDLRLKISARARTLNMLLRILKAATKSSTSKSEAGSPHDDQILMLCLSRREEVGSCPDPWVLVDKVN